MRRFFDSPQSLFWLDRTKCPPRLNQWFQPFFRGDLLSSKGRSLTGAAHQFELQVQNLGHGLLLKILLLTKWRSRPNQWFQPLKLVIDEIDKSNINFANDLINQLEEALGLTGRSVFQFTHRLRRFAQDSGQRFSPRFFTTHNLLIKNEFKITSSRVHQSQKKLLLVRQVWRNL